MPRDSVWMYGRITVVVCAVGVGMRSVIRGLVVRSYRHILKMERNCGTSRSGTVPRLLLFDIDGTLTTSHYKDPISSHPVAQALTEAFGQDIKRNSISFAGGTDQSIIREVLASNGITEDNSSNYQEHVKHALQLLPHYMKKAVKEGQNWWTALPNVHKLLERLSRMQNVQLALLTGNIVEDARIKLESASIDVSLFEIVRRDGKKELLGAFGDDHEIRKKLVPFAQQRYSQYVGKSVLPEDIIIIGDTPKDIACAHDNNVACVAVGTGPCSVESLSNADHLLKDGFVDLDESATAIIETCRR